MLRLIRDPHQLLLPLLIKCVPLLHELLLQLDPLKLLLEEPLHLDMMHLDVLLEPLVHPQHRGCLGQRGPGFQEPSRMLDGRPLHSPRLGRLFLHFDQGVMAY